MRAIQDLKSSYAFEGDEALRSFLNAHPTLPSVLREAVCPLKEAFGDATPFTLELSKEEDESAMLYAIALWHDSARPRCGSTGSF